MRERVRLEHRATTRLAAAAAFVGVREQTSEDALQLICAP